MNKNLIHIYKSLVISFGAWIALKHFNIPATDGDLFSNVYNFNLEVTLCAFGSAYLLIRIYDSKFNKHPFLFIITSTFLTLIVHSFLATLLIFLYRYEKVIQMLILNLTGHFIAIWVLKFQLVTIFLAQYILIRTIDTIDE